MKIKNHKVLIVGAGRIAGTYELDKFRKKPCTHIGAFKKIKISMLKVLLTLKLKKASILKNSKFNSFSKLKKL